MYERAALENWLLRGKGLPHSPNVACATPDLQPCPDMQALLAECRQTYGLRVEYEAFL